MLFLFALLLLSVTDAAQVCNNITLPPLLWKALYPDVYHFQGFNQADGFITLYDPTGAIIPAAYLPPPFNLANPYSLAGSVFHQYFNGAGQMVADLFLGGLAPPGTLIQATRQITNPIFLSGGKLCQNFIISALAPELLTAYSVITPSGKNFMSSAYYSQNAATLDRVFSNEIFNIDGTDNSAWSQTNSYSLGNTTVTNYLSQSVYFKYTPISQTQAIALGYNPANVMP